MAADREETVVLLVVARGELRGKGRESGAQTIDPHKQQNVLH
jgi:hypothetical protein